MNIFRILAHSSLLGLFGTCLLADPVTATSTASGITNQAVIGQASLVTSDPSGQIRNAVGTAASLVEPTKLAPQAPTRLASGQSAGVSAALAYDDGTFTRLSADEISWSSDNSVIQVGPDGMLEVGEVSDRVRVRLTATAEGFSAEVMVRIDPLPEATTSNEPDSGPWTNATALGGNWFQSPWFGSFSATKHNWIYHNGLGWLYPSGNSANSIWLWDQKHQWMWTNRSIYPQLFRHRDQTWLYYTVQVKSRRVFFNYSTNQLEIE